MPMKKYGVAATVLRPVIKAGAVDFATSSDWTPATGDVKVSKDDGAFSNITTLPTAVGNMWLFSLSATEMQAARVVIQVVDSATKAVEDQAISIETYGHASAQHAVDLDDSVRAGLTALPNAAADAAGGLPISDAGGLDLDTLLARLDAAISSRLAPTTSGRTLDVTVGGCAGIDWANVESPTTSVALTGTQISSSQVIMTVTGTVGSVTGSVGSVLGGINTFAGTITTLDALDAAQDTQHSTTQSAISSLNNPTAAAIADAVLDEALSGHTTAGTLGKAIGDGVTAWVTATGFSTLDAAGVRSAIGLASANLDTQLATIDTVVDTILVDTNELQADWTNGGRLDLIVDAILDDTDLIDDATSGLAKIATDVAAVLVDTGTTLPATLTSMAGATFDSATDSLEAIRNRGDAAWTTATGFSTHDAAAVVSALGTGSSLTALATASALAAAQADLDTITDTGVTCVALATDSVTAAALAADAVAEIQSGLSTLTIAQVASEISDALIADTLIDGKTIQQALRIISAVLAGKIATSGTTTEIFLGLDGITTRATLSVDASGNRSTVVYG